MTSHNTEHQQSPADCAPHARRAPRQEGKEDQIKKEAHDAESRQEALVDEGVEETFPASDPVSVKKIT